MYFSSINNSELKQFHKVVPYNFNMSLTDALSSDLFHIETIIPNTLYRIYLLFYCEKITSSNVNDVILENKCIICNKTDEETYFNFISDDNDNIILNHLTGYYSFGDVLTDEDFNSIVQLLRVNNAFAEDIQIKNSTVNGKYGTYVFNLKSTTIVDTGVLITNETLSSIGTVKLMNPIFKNSNYKLKLTVYSLSDVNICNEANTDNIVKTDLIINLIQGSEVNIPFNTLDLNCIVGFNAVVNITHDLPVIQYPQNIVLTSDKLNCFIEEPITLTATYGDTNSPLTDEPITFKNNRDVLGTAVTNSNGIANFSYIPLSTENLNIIAINRDGRIISNNIEIEVDKRPTSISMDVNKTNVMLTDTVTITGVLQDNTGLLSNRTVKIMNGNEELYSVTTDENGSYSKTITANNLFDYNLKAVYNGDSYCTGCESEYINVKSRKIRCYGNGGFYKDGELLSSQITIEQGTTLTIAGYCFYEDWGYASNKSFRIFYGDTIIGTGTTDNTWGNYSLTYQFNDISSRKTIRIVVDGDGTHDGWNWAYLSVEVR